MGCVRVCVRLSVLTCVKSYLCLYTFPASVYAVVYTLHRLSIFVSVDDAASSGFCSTVCTSDLAARVQWRCIFNVCDPLHVVQQQMNPLISVSVPLPASEDWVVYRAQSPGIHSKCLDRTVHQETMYTTHAHHLVSGHIYFQGKWVEEKDVDSQFNTDISKK